MRKKNFIIGKTLLMTTYKLLICGSRYFNDYCAFTYHLDKLCSEILKDFDEIEIVSGGARGADSLAAKYAINNKLKLKEFCANWAEYGKSAGPIRNKQMIDYIKQFENKSVVAFTTKDSRGTRNTIELAKKNGIKCDVIDCSATQITIEEKVKEFKCPGNYFCTVATTGYSEDEREKICTNCWERAIKEENQ